MAANTTVTIEGKEVELTNLDKVFYPETGFLRSSALTLSAAEWDRLFGVASEPPLSLAKG